MLDLKDKLKAYIFRTQGFWCSQDLELFMIETAAYHRTVSEICIYLLYLWICEGFKVSRVEPKAFFLGRPANILCAAENKLKASHLYKSISSCSHKMGFVRPTGWSLLVLDFRWLQSTFWMLAFYEDHPSWRNIVACWGFQWLLVWIWQLPYKTIYGFRRWCWSGLWYRIPENHIIESMQISDQGLTFHPDGFKTYNVPALLTTVGAIVGTMSNLASTDGCTATDTFAKLEAVLREANQMRYSNWERCVNHCVFLTPFLCSDTENATQVTKVWGPWFSAIS